MAHYLLNLGFSDRDKARMHELAQRNRGQRQQQLSLKQAIGLFVGDSMIRLFNAVHTFQIMAL